MQFSRTAYTAYYCFLHSGEDNSLQVWVKVLYLINYLDYNTMKELFLIGVFVIALAMNIFRIKGGAMLLVLSSSVLAMVYFYASVFILNNIPINKGFKKESYVNFSTLRVISSISTGIALAILIVGILFTYMRWPGGKIQLIVGIALSSIILIIGIVKFFKKKEPFYKRLVIRNLMWVIGASLLLIASIYYPQIL